MVGFDLDPGELRPYSQMLQDAKDALSDLSLRQEEYNLHLHQARAKAEQLGVELREANEKLREQAIHDHLTGLYNQRYFQEMLNHQISEVRRYGTTFALLIFDIDNFKEVNDEFGHLAGDEVLKIVADQVSKLVRDCDIVCRIGGDEFGVILTHTDPRGMVILAERMRSEVAQMGLPSVSPGLAISISIGGVCCLQEDRVKEAARLVEAADRFLYRAKQGGRNRAVTGSVREA